MYIRIARDCYVEKKRIYLYIAYNSQRSPAALVNLVKKKREEGKTLDVTMGKKLRTVIFLDTGELLLSGTSYKTIHQRIIGNPAVKTGANPKKGA